MKRHSQALIFLAILAALAACAGPKPQVATESPDLAYERAQIFKHAGNTAEAERLYLVFWQSYPCHPRAAEALFSAAELAEQRDPAEAARRYEKLLDAYPQSSLAPQSRQRLYTLARTRGDLEQAAGHFVHLLTAQPGDARVAEGLSLVQALQDAGLEAQALTLIVTVYPHADEASRSVLVESWQQGLAAVTDPAVLARLKRKARAPELAAPLMSRMALLQTGEDPGLASRLKQRFGDVLPAAPEHARGKVGVVLPLSGKYSAAGQKILRGIQLASGVFSDKPASGIEYVVRDYGDEPERIPAIMDELAADEELLAVIGPLGSQAAALACAETRRLGLPAVTFTQAEMGLQDNSFCFKNFISAGIQARSLLQVAADMGISRFAILAPTDRFGKVFTRTFEELAPTYGVSVVRRVEYSPQRVDFKGEVQSLMEGLPEGAEPDFEALLIPDTAINSAMIASYLEYFNIEGVRLFGPTFWDSPDFVRVGGRYVEDAVFVSGFFLGSQLDFVQEFSDSFYYTFNYNPSLWEASAYDTAMILSNLLAGESLDRDELRDHIGQLRGYPGVTGATSFFPDGSVDKVIFILTVKGGNVVEMAYPAEPGILQ